jgi:mutator protein MutT
MSKNNMPCLFCEIPQERIIASNQYAYAIRDGFPVSRLHTLIIPKRHALDYFELTNEELLACHDLIHELKNDIQSEDPTVVAFNIGLNAGEAAGQTIFHCHTHLIPRRKGDLDDPRGGVRNILPDTTGYLNKTIDVVAGVIKKDGKFLIARRAVGKHLEGFWEYPGGKVESGETDEVSLKRELHEEFGILVNVKQHLVNSFFRYEKVNVNLKAYLVEHVSGDFMLRDHDAIKWVSSTEFKDFKFAPADLPFNDYLLKNGL